MNYVDLYHQTPLYVPMQRLDTVRQFRSRLLQAMEQRGLTQSALARRIGVDRSTLSQLLSVDADRLPRADTVAAIAANLQISLDWLLGLRQEEEVGAHILQQSLQIEPGDPENAARRLAEWHDAAAGYKIRYVPASLPDLMKTDLVIDHEYAPAPSREVDDARLEAAKRLAYSRLPETDVEVCSSMQSVRGFALGQGMWEGLPLDARAAQLERMIRLSRELYPTFRWFLYDAREIWSVPMTIFGPKRAAVYMGSMYFVFNTTEHIRVLTGNFDNLIRLARVQPTDIADYLGDLRELLGTAEASAA